jgi:glutaminase
LRAVFDAGPGIRVYEVQGDLLFAGAEQVLRTADHDRGRYDVAVLDVTRVDDINDAARGMLTGMRANLTAAGKEAYLVDPDGRVVPADRHDDYDAIVFRTLDEAVDAALRWGAG